HLPRALLIFVVEDIRPLFEPSGDIPEGWVGNERGLGAFEEGSEVAQKGFQRGAPDGMAAKIRSEEVGEVSTLRHREKELLTVGGVEDRGAVDERLLEGRLGGALRDDLPQPGGERPEVGDREDNIR